MPDRYDWPVSGPGYNAQLRQINGADAANNPVEGYFKQRADEASRLANERWLGAAMTTGMSGMVPQTAPVALPLSVLQAIMALQKERATARLRDGESMWTDTGMQGAPDAASEMLAKYGGGRRGPQ